MLKGFLEDDSIKNQMSKKIYHLIHQRGPITKNDLLHLTKTKQTTLNRFMDDLVHSNVIVECGYGESSGGRPPVLYKVNEKAAYIIGIDISRIQTKLVLVNLAYHTIEQTSFAMTEKETPSIVFAKMNQIITKWISEYNIAWNQLLGIGVGTVGPVQREEGVIVKPEAFLAPRWENVHVARQLREYFPVKIIVDNGANSAVVAEYSQYPSYENILYVIGGYGIRCGVICNGQLLHSKLGDSSAYGHIIVHAGDTPTTKGKKGSLSHFATFGAMVKEWKQTINEERDVTFSDLLYELKRGNPSVIKIVEKAAYYYGIGIANMVNVLHPELVVLHGHLISESNWYYQEVVKQAKSHLYIEDKSLITFSKGTFGADAIAIGAAIQVFQSYFG
ncbi:ROK family protein [Alkalihalobacterium bogoriense]|uniref:ROK family protein n=1 Tax=Alkalihalobacterium bogoriense TaxID=246272 RepID=UPI00047DB3E3|nr:ROK family protein [Alkalihalobacterium bogoriense]